MVSADDGVAAVVRIGTAHDRQVTRRAARFADEAVVDRDRREGVAVDDPFLRCATCGRVLDGEIDGDWDPDR